MLVRPSLSPRMARLSVSGGSITQVLRNLGVAILLSCCFTGTGWSLPAGLISAWSGNGTAADSTGLNNGSFSGTYVTGMNGQQAFSFNGGTPATTDFFASTTNLPTGSGARTISFWVNVQGIIANTTEGISVGYGSYSGNQMYEIYTGNPSNQLLFSQYGWAFGGPNLTLNQWTYVAVTYDSNGSLVMYVNGTAVATSNYVLATTTGSQFWIGSAPFSTNGNRQGDAYVQNVRVYGSALTSSQIVNDMNSVSLSESGNLALLVILGTLSLALARKPGSTAN